MDFTEDPDHRLIRAAVREICVRFPGQTQLMPPRLEVRGSSGPVP